MVSGPREVEALQAEGVQAGTIWTVDQLLPMLKDPGVTHDDAIRIARLRQVFNATVVEDFPPEATPAEPAPDASQEPQQGTLDLDKPLQQQSDQWRG